MQNKMKWGFQLWFVLFHSIERASKLIATFASCFGTSWAGPLSTCKSRDYTLSFRWTGNVHAALVLQSTCFRFCYHRYGYKISRHIWLYHRFQRLNWKRTSTDYGLAFKVVVDLIEPFWFQGYEVRSNLQFRPILRAHAKIVPPNAPKPRMN